MISKLHHFDQQVLLTYDCDAQDLLLLEWLDDGMTTSRLPEAQIGADSYYLVSPYTIEDDLPLLNLQPRTIQQRLGDLVNKGILSRILVGKGKQNDSYYGKGEHWAEVKPES